MADNQITPFQLTDQFTMDNFNQRINETNTALQNNDPRQWGLGADSILVDSLDNALETGWYKSNGATPASGYWNCLTERYNSQSITQTAVQYDNYGASIARRMLSLGVFGPWEWVNPPMELGVEYRTQERYLGKPVYRKLIWGGPLPNSGYTGASIASGCIIIQAVCHQTSAASASEVAPSTIGDVIPWNNNDDNGINMSAFKNHVNLWCKINRSSSNFVAYLWYIKDTD